MLEDWPSARGTAVTGTSSVETLEAIVMTRSEL
jgi:hypothetical protein